MAPGVNIYSTIGRKTYGYMSGTSIACPMVSGVCALILSVCRHLRLEEVRFILRESATDLGDSMRDDIYGYELVNADQTVDFVSLDSDCYGICNEMEIFYWNTDPNNIHEGGGE